MTALDFARHARRQRAAQSRPMPFDAAPPGVSGFRGVHFQRDKGKYRAVIEVDGVRLHLGYFGFATAAARAYDAAALAAWGADAVINFPAGGTPCRSNT